MKIAIYGLGVVGNALDHWLSRKHEVLRRDPARGMGDPIADADAIFVCVPTPTAGPTVRGALDTSAVEAVLTDILAEAGADVPVVIRSTLWPGMTDRLQERMPNPLLYTPEFLTEKTALEDELFPTRHIIGTTSKSAHLAPQILELLAEPDYYAIVSARVAEVIKLATNAFYATKVTFFNQVYDLCDGLGVDYEMVRASMAMDMMTAAEHLDVHHNGYRGFGGKCLPKDTLALLVTHVIGPADDDGTWEPIDPDKTLIANALSYNNLLRGGKLDRDGG